MPKSIDDIGRYKRRKTDKGLLRYMAIFPIAVLAFGVAGTWAVNDHRIDELEKNGAEYVKERELELQLEPLKDELERMSSEVEKNNATQWQILLELKKQGRVIKDKRLTPGNSEF